jgi:nicotinamidase-related amidase
MVDPLWVKIYRDAQKRPGLWIDYAGVFFACQVGRRPQVIGAVAKPGHFHYNGRMEMNNNLKLLLPEESLLMIVDLQDKFLPFLKHSKRVLQSTKLLIAVARELRIPMVVTEHNPKRIGPTVPELAEKLEDVPVLAKEIFSCFGDPAIKAAIGTHQDLKNILLVGCETHICIMQTTIDALALGYNVHVAANGVSSRKELDWKVGLERIARCGAVVATSEMIAYELLKRSDTANFKALLPQFKDWVNRSED